MGIGAASAVIMLMMIASVIIPYIYAEVGGGNRGR
jgi:glucose/mannose transport system permease protein